MCVYKLRLSNFILQTAQVWVGIKSAVTRITQNNGDARVLTHLIARKSFIPGKKKLPA